MYKFSFFDLIPYGLLLMTCLLLGLNKIKGLNSAGIICVVLILFSAIRYGVGYDYFAYVGLVEKQVPDYELLRVEWFSRLLMDLSYKIHFTQFYFIICSIFTILPIYYISKNYSVYPAFSLLLYFLHPIFYLDSFSIVRNALAYSIVCFSIHLLVNKRYLLYILSIVCAGGIHNSAYIGLIIPLIYYFRFGRKFNVLFFISILFFSSAIVLGLFSFLANHFQVFDVILNYTELHEKQQGPFLKIIIYTLNIINLIFWNRLVAVNKMNRIFLNTVNFGTCLWMLFSFEATLSLRLSSYFLLFDILLLPSYMYIYNQKFLHRAKLALTIFFFALFCSSFYINVIGYVNKKDDKISFLPYQTFFFHKDFKRYD